MELNHNKKRGGLWLRFQDTGQRCVAILTKKTGILRRFWNYMHDRSKTARNCEQLLKQNN